MKLLVACVFIALLSLAQCEASLEEMQTCMQENCAQLVEKEKTATDEQRSEYFKYNKCENGEDSSADLNNVAASITQDPKCVTKASMSDIVACSEACLVHFTDGNPLKDTQVCNNNCMSANVLAFSAILAFVIAALI